MITLKNLEKYYTNKFIKTFVLRNINLEIREGEFLSVMGPSGSGKSTLLNIIGMLDTPSGGEYFFYDEPVHKKSEKQLTELHRNHIGFVFQSYHLIDELTVFENIEMPLLYQKVKAEERKGRVAEILDRFNMVAKKDLFPNQLSGGQQQLAAIGRAIIGNPKLILADEPTGNLHTDKGKEIMELLKNLNQEGTTIIQVTHSEENAKYGNRIINLSDGWIEE
ncbi:MAG: ABC transporter ATP-binding protein [Melioribacteraceae bacterium]|jgi:putative ABC transport system ATP-binding protein|nr:ABC transporter ATP-binding protein [Melioribacteraceae bacterium]